MTDILPFLKNLISTSGLSGHEAPVRALIKETWTPLTDQLTVSKLGSLQGLQRGTAPEPRPSVLLAAHMDAIGLMVTSIADGFLRITEVGGLDPRVLPGQPVTVHTRRGEELPGVIVQPPARLLPKDVKDGPLPLKYLMVDTGLLPEEVFRLVHPGDPVSFAQMPIETAGETLSGHTLDNRASVAAVTVCLQELKNRPHNWDVWAVATVQEEETLGGALTSAFELKPTIGIAIDVTFAESPGSPGHRTFPLGEGPALGWGPNAHPAVFKKLKEAAEKLEMSYHLEPMPRYSGTDAMALQIAAAGVPTAVVSIPLRYMHTPVEMVSMKDIHRTGRLLAEFITQLTPDFPESLSWDE